MTKFFRLSFFLLCAGLLLTLTFAERLGLVAVEPLAAASQQATNLTETKLIAPVQVSAAQYGAAVALQGSVALIGAPGDEGNVPNSGAAYVLRYDNGAWSAPIQLVASDGAAGNGFGAAVALGQELAVVGAPNTNAVYIFRYDGADWVEEAKLQPDNIGDTRFGFTVATSGQRVVVGAPYRDSGVTNSGAVYVYEYDGTTWQKMVRLISSSQGGAVGSDLFGWSVAIQGDTLVVGAYLHDMAYIFGYNGTTWSEVDTVTGSEDGSRFGYAVALDGSTLVVGAPQDSDAGVSSGAIYIFIREGTEWQAVTKRTPGSTMRGSRLGWSVAAHGSRVAAGARESKGQRDREESGAAYLYERMNNQWREAAQVNANDGASFDHFGAAVALAGEHLLVGAPDHDTGGENAGAAYAYRLTDTSPNPTATATPVETVPPDASPTPVETTPPDASPTPVETTPPDASPTPVETRPPDSSPTPPASPTPRASPTPHSTDCEAMSVGEESTETVSPGVAITWGSSFHCVQAPDEGPYGFIVRVAYQGPAGSTVNIESLGLTHTTPRPQGQGPEATVEVSGLPLLLAAGEEGAVTVEGTYELVVTGASRKANLHFCAAGTVTSTNEPFTLGLNGHLRGNHTDAADNSPAGPPVVSNVEVIRQGNSVLIRWRTDQPTTGRVRIGIGEQMEEMRALSTGCGAAQEHSVTISNLTPDTEYHAEISATNNDGAVGASAQFVVTTGNTQTSKQFMPVIRNR